MESPVAVRYRSTARKSTRGGPIFALAGEPGACYHAAAFKRPCRTVEMLTSQSSRSADELKREAAARALEFVRPGMRLGLGTGSTAAHFVDLLAEKVKAGFKITGVPTSEATKRQAEGLGVPLRTLDEMPELDLTIDGADEVDAALDLIKGGGGALLREKIVACASREMIVIADESKYVQRLGRFPLPIEVVDFGIPAILRSIEAALAAEGCKGPLQVRRKADGHVFVTDQGHCIVDAALTAIPDAPSLARRLAEVAGVVEHGLFIGVARRAILAGPSGVRIVEKV
jgi:ribose 5-phosphate isomerase A